MGGTTTGQPPHMLRLLILLTHRGHGLHVYRFPCCYISHRHHIHIPSCTPIRWLGLPTCSVVHWDPKVLLSLIHISEPTRLLSISYAVFCLKKKKTTVQKKVNSLSGKNRQARTEE
eukprot:TRINITY_DN35094_c0_g1_i1.p1 TRINITY_DN35094_c0_g1~~TRINITY_DN35094_c0_g1_i1.p1  ORF type:complete len:116 (-),score=12.16 TRINITY_DN35094_c0_g1_i1:21-368(-)